MAVNIERSNPNQSIKPMGQIMLRLILLQSHIFDDGSLPWGSKMNTERFLVNYTVEKKLTEFTRYLSRNDMISVVRTSLGLHRNDKRKVTGDPYFKHLFYSAYLGFISPEFDKHDENYRRIFLTANLLHDSIEMKRKTNPQYKEKDLYKELENTNLTDDEKRKIVLIVSLLTPPTKSETVKKDEKKWLKAKLKDFKKIIEMKAVSVVEKDQQVFSKILGSKFKLLSPQEYLFLLEAIKEIKINDEVANVIETTDDLQMGKDGCDIESNGIKPLSWRYEDYIARFTLLKTYSGEHFLMKSLKDSLTTIYDYLEQRESNA